MKTAIIGSRGISNYEIVSDVLKEYQISNVISGGAKGVDSLAERYVTDNSLSMTVFKPDWAQYGRAAGPIRNRHIVDAAECVIAFWDGKSKGTLDSITYAKKIGKKVDIWEYDENNRVTRRNNN